MPDLMQAPTSPGGYVIVPLPCEHHRVRLTSTEQTVRKCRTCRKYWMIEYRAGDVALVTDISCHTCAGEMESMGDLWFCLSCGDEFDDESIRGRERG